MTYESKMDIDRAREVVAEVIDQRKKWGIQLSYRDFNKDDLLDALIVLQEEGIETASALVAKANRQQGAYKAQLAKAEKLKEKLREDIEELKAAAKTANDVATKALEEQGMLQAQLAVMTADRDSLRVELDDLARGETTCT